MNTSNDQQLLSELQELYLQNKQWFSDVLFLEDEICIFRKLYDRFFSVALKENQLKQVEQLNAHFITLEKQRNELKDLIIKHQSILEAIIIHPDKIIGLDLIEENTKIINDIKTLFTADVSIKKELYSLIESLIEKEKAGHLLES